MGQPAFQVRTDFYSNREWPLSGGPSAPLAAKSSAQVGIIDLHPASQNPIRFPFLHGPEDLVLETPGRPPGDPQAAHQLQGTGPCGYGLHRQIIESGHDCEVVASSRIPKRPGDRI